MHLYSAVLLNSNNKAYLVVHTISGLIFKEVSINLKYFQRNLNLRYELYVNFKSSLCLLKRFYEFCLDFICLENNEV